MNNIVSNCISVLKKQFGDIEILGCYDNNKSLMFSIKPKNMEVYDAFFLVDKATGKVSEYAYLNDLENFKDMQNNPKRKININKEDIND